MRKRKDDLPEPEAELPVQVFGLSHGSIKENDPQVGIVCKNALFPLAEAVQGSPDPVVGPIPLLFSSPVKGPSLQLPGNRMPSRAGDMGDIQAGDICQPFQDLSVFIVIDTFPVDDAVNIGKDPPGPGIGQQCIIRMGCIVLIA